MYYEVNLSTFDFEPNEIENRFFLYFLTTLHLLDKQFVKYFVLLSLILKLRPFFQFIYDI